MDVITLIHYHSSSDTIPAYHFDDCHLGKIRFNR